MATRRSDPSVRLNLVTGSAVGGPDVMAGVDGSAVVEAGVSEYALFKAGKIDFEQYVELSVDRAVAHVRGHVSAEQLDAMRQVLRSALADDPQLSALAARVAQSA